jgi:two-component system, sensor histidine kinase and response regulator
MNAVDSVIKARILIVDDEEMIARSISDLLDCYHIVSNVVHNGSDAMEFLGKNPDTDIVLLDINLGFDFSGIDLIPIIKEKNKYVQIIMFTSEDRLETGVECMRKGAYDYMTKPFDEQAFLSKVPGALERKKIAQLNDLYLGIIVHDMKNPLQGFMSSIELMRMSLPDTPTDLQKKSLMQADIATNQILMMVNNIVSVSRFENGTLSARRELFILQKEVAAALALFISAAKVPGNRSLEISYSQDRDILIAADKDLFCRVLVNIVSNAVRFADEDSIVAVNFTVEENAVLHAKITNSGSCIEEHARESIFDKFSSVQVNPSQSGFKNYGLGLTFSKMAVKAMDGNIWITCNPIESSTTFHFTIKNRDRGPLTAAS